MKVAARPAPRAATALRRRRAAAWLAGVGMLLMGAAAQAGPTLTRIQTSGTLRVCIWPEYFGISFRSPRNQQLSGLDIDMSTELAGKLGVRLVHVDSSFASLIGDLRTGRCDISMHAVGITAERQQYLRFSQPYLRSDIYGITTRTNRVIRRWADIDQPGVKVAVQGGTVMEPVMAATLKNAQLVVIRPPATREQELQAGRVDVFMTDYPYSRLLDNAEWARLVSPERPFHLVSYAYAIAAGDEDWLRALDEFVAEVKRDGRLQRAAAKFGLGEIVITQ